MYWCRLILLNILFLVNHQVIAQPDQFHFDQLTTKNGLAFNTVTSIFQDSRGFMWISTWGGIDRYDGVRFKNYKTNHPQYNQPFICSIEDSQGNLWFGGHGFISYDPFTDSCKNIGIKSSLKSPGVECLAVGPDNKLYISNAENLYIQEIPYLDAIEDSAKINVTTGDLPFERINSFQFDHQGKLWLATDQGLFNYFPETDSIAFFDDIKYPPQKWIHDFLFDPEGNVWVAFNQQLVKYNFKDLTTVYIDLSTCQNPVLTKLFLAKDNRIWIGTHRGIFYVSDENLLVQPLLNNYQINAIYEDNDNRLWIGTASSGVFIYDSLKNYFKSLSVNVHKQRTDKFSASIIAPARKNGLWIGCWDLGLLYYDFQTNETKHIDDQSSQIHALYEDNKGNVWYNDMDSYSIVKYNQETNTIRKFRHPVPQQFPIMNYGNTINNIIAFNGQLIITSDYGIVYKFDPVTEEFSVIYESKNDNQGAMRSILIDGNKILLPVYFTGIIEMNKDFQITNIYHQDSTDMGVLGYAIMAIHKDLYDTIWVGGFGGLSKFNPEKGYYEKKFAFSSSFDYITSILEDEAGNLWLGSSRGIYLYNRKTQKLTLFDVWDGIAPGRFWSNCAVKARDGRMYFGGNNGIVYFDPKKVKNNQRPPPIVFTGFDIRNKPGKLKSRVLTRDINFTRQINLKYWQNFFTIHYAALNYTSPQQNQYKYKLEGIEGTWNQAGNQSSANYTGLPAGHYTFKVMGSNNEGVWNENPRQLEIFIAPPPWKTWWAYGVYFLMAAGIVAMIYHYNLRKIRIQHQLELKNQEAEKLLEIDQAKSGFFTNISHEFRTPLSLIIDPAKRLLQQNNLDLKQKNLLGLIKWNAQRLLYLINQVLDLAKMESGHLTIKARETELVKFLNPIANSFTSQAESMQIVYHIDLPQNEIILWIDQEKIEKVIINLLSNAFKFCIKGSIRLSIREESNQVILMVQDTGIGIADDQLDKIFNKFYQVENLQNKNLAGTGIGLALAKEYVELHQGKIAVESRENKGTRFIVQLPKGNRHFSADQIDKESASFKPGEADLPDQLLFNGEKKAFNFVPGPAKILIVEDNQVMLNYLKDNLSPVYQVILAKNGEEGWKKTLEDQPDLIVSDIMMPVMDGHELCRKVKEDPRTSHIPVILLTAKSELTDKLAGLNLGADDYLNKPFNSEELELRIRNLLEQQKRLRAKFSLDFKLKISDELITAQKDKFLQQVLKHIQENLQNEQFGVEHLSELMCMSRKHLHRKIKALTGLAPNQLIRNFRLRRAAYLLSQDAGNITDICYQVGFTAPSYFRKCFYELFNQNPSEYYHKHIE